MVLPETEKRTANAIRFGSESVQALRSLSSVALSSCAARPSDRMSIGGVLIQSVLCTKVWLSLYGAFSYTDFVTDPNDSAIPAALQP